jgi:hypothetical protein
MAWACSGDRKYLPSRRPYCGQVFRAAGIGAGALDHRHHGAGFPRRADQRFLGLGRRRRSLDQGDDRVDVGQRNRLAFKDVATLAGLAQLEHGAAGHHFAAVTDERFEQVLEVEQRGRPSISATMLMPNTLCSWVCW